MLKSGLQPSVAWSESNACFTSHILYHGSGAFHWKSLAKDLNNVKVMQAKQDSTKAILYIDMHLRMLLGVAYH